SANCELRNSILQCDQVRVIRDEGAGTGRFTCDFGKNRLVIEGAKTNISPGVVAAWIDPPIGKILQPFRFTGTPTMYADGIVQLENGYPDDLRIQIDMQDPFAYRFDGWEIPFERGSGDFSLLGADPTNLVVN